MTGVLNKLCDVKRPVVTQEALGQVRAWGDGYHLEDVPCALQQQSGARLGELGETTDGLSVEVSRRKLWFPIGTDLVKTDRVIVEGVTYEVVGVNPDVAGVGHHGTADLLEVRP